MTYYRIAIRALPSTTLRWLTTHVSSLQAVSNWIQTYRCLSPRLRIFCAPSVDNLDAMLRDENRGQKVTSLSVEGIFREWRGAPRTHTQVASRPQVLPRQGSTSSPIATVGIPLVSGTHLTYSASDVHLSTLDSHRLALEQGVGGDHDMPYVFAFPRAAKEYLAWIRLRARIQGRELMHF